MMRFFSRRLLVVVVSNGASLIVVVYATVLLLLLIVVVVVYVVEQSRRETNTVLSRVKLSLSLVSSNGVPKSLHTKILQEKKKKESFEKMCHSKNKKQKNFFLFFVKDFL